MLLPLDVLSLVFFSLSASHLAGVPQVSAALVNVTVDDTSGDPLTGNQISYQPPGGWHQGQTCETCTDQPSRSQAFNGTWHGSIFNHPGVAGVDEFVSATLSFEGVAVYVFCIIARSVNSPEDISDMSFFIDNASVGRFQQPPAGDTTYFYNVPVYVNESLSPGQHTITVLNRNSNGNNSLTLLDYIVYTRVDNSTARELVASFTSNGTMSSTQSPSPSVMASGSSSSSSSRRTIIIAVVASIAGVLVLIVLIAAIIYCGRRRAKAKANDPSQNGVISPDAVPIDQEDPDTSGWVEGTWAGDEDSGQDGVLRAPSNGRRKRGPSNASSSYPNTPSTRSLNKSLPSVSNIQTARLPYSRPDVVSPTSSFGNLGSAPPDSATFLISTTSPPPPVPPIPPVPSVPPARPQRPPNESDTFLDMGQSYNDTKLSTLSSHTSHPFATAQAYNPPSLGYLRQRADTHTTTTTTTTIPPPSASSGALAAATRGYTYAATSGPTRKRSGSDLEREQQRRNAHSRKRSGSDLSNSNYTRLPVAPASPPRRAGSDLEVNYARAGTVVNPLAPTVTRKRSGSDLEGYNRSLQSPNTFVSTLPSTTTSPTSMTTLVPKRNPSPRPQVTEKSSASSLSLSTSHGHSQGHGQGQRIVAQAQPRKVDPIDPSLHPLLERQASSRDRERERAKAQQEGRTQTEEQALSRNRSGRRGGMVMSDRERQRFGFLDVPQDASDSRPPSYREADR